MKLLLDITDNKVDDIVKMLQEYSYVKIQQLSKPDADILDEIKEIKKSFSHAKQIKAGKLKGRPIEELLNEL